MKRQGENNMRVFSRCRLIIIIIHNYVCVFSKIVRGARTGSRRCRVTLPSSSDQSQRSLGHIANQPSRCELADNCFRQSHNNGISGLLTLRMHLSDFTWLCKLLMFLKDDFNFKKSVTLVNHITHLDHTHQTLHKGLT